MAAQIPCCPATPPERDTPQTRPPTVPNPNPPAAAAPALGDAGTRRRRTQIFINRLLRPFTGAPTNMYLSQLRLQAILASLGLLGANFTTRNSTPATTTVCFDSGMNGLGWIHIILRMESIHLVFGCIFYFGTAPTHFVFGRRN
jgi:hypothetical protein